MLELETMTADECWRRLDTGGVGRVGFDRGRGPRIHPVDYTVVDRVLYVRTTNASEFGEFVRMFGGGAWVSFEVDQVDATTGDRWSVLVDARVGQLDPELERALQRGQAPVPAPSGPDSVLVRLSPIEITGRLLVDSGHTRV